MPITPFLPPPNALPGGHLGGLTSAGRPFLFAPGPRANAAEKVSCRCSQPGLVRPPRRQAVVPVFVLHSDPRARPPIEHGGLSECGQRLPGNGQ